MTPPSLFHPLILGLIIPLAGAVLVGLAGWGKRQDQPLWMNVRDGASLVTATLLLINVLCFDLDEDAVWSAVTLFEMLPGLTITLALEPLGWIFTLLAAFLWIVTTLYAIGYMRGHREVHQTRFFICFAIAIASAMGVATAGNLFTLFVFYEILSVSTYPLVTHAGTPGALRAGRVYLGILMGTSMVFFLPAMIWTWRLAGSLDFLPGGILAGKAPVSTLSIIMALFFFGVAKAAVMPFHRWLPAAMVAPTPVSALLHAVAVVKAGVFTILKVTIYIFGVDLMSVLGSQTVLLYVATGTILIASLAAMRQDNLKRRLAYSTISQLSYIVVGAMIAVKSGILGGGFQMVAHAFGKITLFFGAGAILVASHKTRVSELNGIGRAMPITMTAFLIGALSICGLPPFPGSLSKHFLLDGAAEIDADPVIWIFWASTLMNVYYLVSIPLRALFLKPQAPLTHGEAPWPCVAAQIIVATGCLLLIIFPDSLVDLLERIPL